MPVVESEVARVELVGWAAAWADWALVVSAGLVVSVAGSAETNSVAAHRDKAKGRAKERFEQLFAPIFR
jgi:hypothetical protein